ncbi:hypothetical protein [Microbispora bryophytorum]|uniref:hypothetical protein n=1 Tax=Microbispora bryophytorum TaxID=1460882 RepID=UPI0033E96BF5
MSALYRGNRAICLCFCAHLSQPHTAFGRSRDDELIEEILKGGIATAPEAGEVIFAEVGFSP